MLVVLFLVYLVKRLVWRTRRHSRLRPCEYKRRPAGTASRDTVACPAPLFLGSQELKQAGSYFPKASSNFCMGIDHPCFSNEAVPASVLDRRAQVEELLTLISEFCGDLSRDAMKLYCGEPPTKSCMRSSRRGRGSKLRVRIATSTAEPAVTRQNA